MTTKERWTASRQRNAEAVATQADRIMADTRYDRLRTRGRASLSSSGTSPASCWWR
jgi:hypothetical protein